MYSLFKLLSKSNSELIEEFNLDESYIDVKRELIDWLESEKLLIHDYVFHFPSKPIPLQEIICKRLSDNDVIDELSDNNYCSPLSGKIASNLIKVGATRIFAEPERSFIEPVVNAIDAYQIKNGKRPTGKFGIGFYSLLYWIIKYPGSYLSIYSNPIPGSDSEAFQPWEAIITDTNIKINPVEQENNVRFRIELVIKDLDIESSIYYVIIGALKYITTAKLIIKRHEDDEIDEIIIGNGDIVRVNVIQGPEITKLIVEDNALGLPIYKLGDLLVPSLSTKTIRSSSVNYTPKVGKLTKINKEDFSSSKILVGEILLLKLFDNNGIIIQLSPQTSLPVSRDDILISDKLTREEFELNVFHLLYEGLKNDPQNEPRNLINTMSNYPTGNYLVPRLMQAIADEGYLAVPYEFFNIYKQITKRKIVGIDDYLSIGVENIFISDNKPNFDIFVGRGVYYVDVDELTFANSISLVFLNKNEISNENMANWIFLFQEYSLIPRKLEWNANQKLSVMIDKLIGNLEPYNLLQILFGRLYGLRSIFKEESVLRTMDYISKFFQDNRDKDEQFLSQVISGFIKTCGLFKPETAYGVDQKILFINTEVLRSKYSSEFFYIPSEWQDLYLELYEKLIPLMAEEDILFIKGSQYFISNTKSLEIKKHIKNVEEWIYLYTFYMNSFNIFGSMYLEMLDYWRSYLQSKTNIKILFRSILYQKLLTNDINYESPNNLYETVILKSSENYYNLISSVSKHIISLPRIPKLKKISHQKYYLSKLLQNVFEGKSLENISIERGTLPIQILEIAVNEGTTRNPLEAMITETFQNSLDASRTEGIDKTIKIDFGRSDDVISYSISDSVGIDPEQIIYLSIPFLSSKTDPFSAGSIGSGFFTVYNRAILVNINTVRDGIRTVVLDEPIRENGRVIDILRNIGYSETIAANGTKITVLFRSEKPEEELSIMLTFCQNVLPLTTDSFYLNDKNIQIKTEPLADFTSEYMEVRIGSDFESYVLTKGTPFAQLSKTDLVLSNYASSYINSGLLINLKKGFEPVQSRNKIRIEDPYLYDDLMRDITYYFMLHKQINEPKFEYISNYTSTASIYQILPPQSYQDKVFFPNLSTFLWYYIPMNGEDNIATKVLNLFYGEILANTTLANIVANNWYKKKDLSKDRVTIDIKTNNSDDIDDRIISFAQLFINSYVSALKIDMEAPEFKVSILSVDGSYNVKENVIRLSKNYRMTSPSDILTYDSILEYLKDNFSIYGKKYPSAILIHELEHFRRQENHSRNSHGNIYIDGKYYTFDESANYYYDLAVKNGLFDIMLENY